MWNSRRIGTPGLVTLAARQSVMPVTARRVLPLILQCNQARANGDYAWACTYGDARWTRHISGIKPKPVCGWRRACRGTIRREENSWSLPTSFGGRPRNSKPRLDSRQHADADFFSGSKTRRLAAPSAHHERENSSFIFKRLGRNPAPPPRVILLEKRRNAHANLSHYGCGIGAYRLHRNRHGGSGRRGLVRSPSPLLQLLRRWRNLERLPARLDRSGRRL